MNRVLGTVLALTLSTSSVYAGVSGGNANSNWTIYGWQNWSYEMIDDDNRDFTRINNNAANIGFSASIDTGISDLKANFQCEQFTFHNRFNGASDFCNRNSKMSLSGSWGELMVGQWLLPYNEMVAQWVDPFYDAGADSHTSIMGNTGGNGNFYNGSGFGDANSFNRRQEEIIQYFSPNISGFNFRVATTNAHRDTDEYAFGGGDNRVTNLTGVDELDPRIWSMGASYESTLESGTFWVAATYERHDEWSAVSYSCSDSEDTGYRLAARFTHNMANGGYVKLAGMWENLEYDLEDCSSLAGLLQSGGLPSNGDIELERDSWMVSGVLGFGNGFDIRASYMDADEIDADFGGLGSGEADDTDASAYNVGIFYTMPAGTELRATYSKVDNEDNSCYDFGIGATQAQCGDDVEMFAVGIVQWF